MRDHSRFFLTDCYHSDCKIGGPLLGGPANMLYYVNVIGSANLAENTITPQSLDTPE